MVPGIWFDVALVCYLAQLWRKGNEFVALALQISA